MAKKPRLQGVPCIQRLRVRHTHPPLLPALLPGNALVYECVKAVAAIHPSPVLIAGAVESVSRFLASRCSATAPVGRNCVWAALRIEGSSAIT